MLQYAFPLLAVLIWSGNTVVNKLAAGLIEPAEIGFYRWLLAGLLLTPFMLKPLWTQREIVRANFGRIVVLGVLGMASYQSLAYYAAHLTSATHMGLIQALMPLMALVLAIQLLSQKLGRGALPGAALSLLGVLLVVTHGQPLALLQHGINLGDGLMLVATLAYAIYSVLLRRWQIALPTLQLLYAQILVAIVALFPLYLLTPKSGLNGQNLPLVLYAALFASLLAQLAWMKGVARLGPSRTAIFFNLTPLFTALIAAWVLHEQLALYHLLGGGLVVAGVLVSERWKSPRSAGS